MRFDAVAIVLRGVNGLDWGRRNAAPLRERIYAWAERYKRSVRAPD